MAGCCPFWGNSIHVWPMCFHLFTGGEECFALGKEYKYAMMMGIRGSETACFRSTFLLYLLTNILSDQVLSFSSICVWDTLYETSDVGLFQTTLYGDLSWAFRAQLELPLWYQRNPTSKPSVPLQKWWPCLVSQEVSAASEIRKKEILVGLLRAYGRFQWEIPKQCYGW